MTYKKVASVKVPAVSSTASAPILVYEVPENTEIIVSKIYVFNPIGNKDIRVHIFFVDKNNPDEYDSTNDRIIEESTQAFDFLVPGFDTAIFGSGITLAGGQCVYVRSIGGRSVVHIFGKVLKGPVEEVGD